jgi:urease accessory protein
MDTRSLLNGLRFVDSFFPSGGYAFSSGLEAAVQDGAVRDADDLSRYVEDWLQNGVGRCDAVAVAKVHAASTSRHLPSALQTDHALDAMKLCRETRMASRQMGRQVIRIAAEQSSGSKFLHDYGKAVDSGRAPGHLAVILGLILEDSGWKRDEAVAAYLYQNVIGLVSAALKLLPIGQREAQRMLAGWLPLIEEVSLAADAGMDMMSWTPVQDIYAMRHSRLTSRLFRS